MSQYRKFHLNKFPLKEIFVILNPNFRKIFFVTLYKKIGGSTILSRIIKTVKDEEIRRWKVGIRSIPLHSLFSLNELLRNEKFSIEELEKNVVGYKVKHSRKIIYGPKFPLIEDERLVRITIHMICDGYDGGKNHSPAYFNTEKTLVDNFVSDLEVFGKVRVTRRERKQKKGNKLLYIIEFPKVISYLLRYLYKIKFGSKVVRVPESFFNFSRSLRFQVIKAFADDESSVRESRITFISSNSELLQDLKQLIVSTLGLSFKDVTKVYYVSSSKVYNFDLKRTSINKYYKYVNYDHPKKKILLELMIDRKSSPGNKYGEGEAQRIILDTLSHKQTSAIELSLLLGIKANSVRYHLHKLKKWGKVVEFGKG